jgi:hypothetical protein
MLMESMMRLRSISLFATLSLALSVQAEDFAVTNQQGNRINTG